MQITINLPDALQISEEDLRTELAIALFQQERITLGTASQLAGLHQIEFQRLIASRDIYVHYDIEDLEDAEGNTWIMKGFELGLKPQHTYDEFLAALPSVYQKLPEGWKVRVKTLEEDLIEKPEGGVATIMTDEFFNVYDKTGPGMTNYKP